MNNNKKLTEKNNGTHPQLQSTQQQKKYFFDHAKNVRRVIHLLIFVCAVLFALDFIIDRHTSHPWDALPGFYAIYGLIGCILLVVIAKWMRALLMRPLDYYQQNNDAENRDKQGGSDDDLAS